MIEVIFESKIQKGTVTEPLSDQSFFKRAKIASGGRAIEWPGGVDFCADSLWFEGKPVRGIRKGIVIMKVATYSRVSTRHHDQKPEIQVNELRRYCRARGWKITHEIVDHHTGGTDDRPGLKKLLDLVRTRQVDAVVVLKLDRLFRSLKHLLASLEEFDALGVQFIAVKDAVDWTTPSGRFFLQVLGSLAEFERGLLRERTMLGLEHARASGKILGRPKVHDDAAIRKLRKKGLSYTVIQKRLGVSKGAVCRALSGIPKKRPTQTAYGSRSPGGYGLGYTARLTNRAL